MQSLRSQTEKKTNKLPKYCFSLELWRLKNCLSTAYAFHFDFGWQVLLYVLHPHCHQKYNGTYRGFRHWAGNLFDPDLSQCAWKSTLGGTRVPCLATSRKLSKYIEQKPLGLYTDWPINLQVPKNIPSFFNGEGGGGAYVSRSTVINKQVCTNRMVHQCTESCKKSS